MSIITTSDLQTYMNSPDDWSAGRAAQVVDAVNAHINSVTGRSWGEPATATDELHDYAPVIFLNHQDVRDITAVTTGRGTGNITTLNADSYFVNPGGRLVLGESRTGFTTMRDYVTVTYTYGTDTVPADLKLAGLALASDYYTYSAESGKEVSSEGVGSYRVDYKSGAASASGASLAASIERYRTKRI